MSFRPDKCNVLSVTQKQILFTLHTMSTVSPSRKLILQNLGVTIQSNLKWDKHINNITSKANQTLGFQHYENTPTEYVFTAAKMKSFRCKNVIFLLFLLKIPCKDCGYSLEPIHQGGSNEYPQSMFYMGKDNPAAGNVSLHAYS